MSESARSVLKHLYKEGRMTEEQFQKIDRNLKERPHGKWIYHKEWECDGECAFECSKCGMGFDVDYNFCPRCGADMREGDMDG